MHWCMHQSCAKRSPIPPALIRRVDLGGGNAGMDLSVACQAAGWGPLRTTTQFVRFAKGLRSPGPTNLIVASGRVSIPFRSAALRPRESSDRADTDAS
jgi:hypothetical protein